MHLIIGLGNPGKGYDGTRHNIGKETVRFFAEAYSDVIGRAPWSMDKARHAETVHIDVDGAPCIAALPTTYMNESGRAAQALLAYYKIDARDLIVVHDDIDLSLGTIRFSQGSGSGGNRGVDAIIQAIGTKNFTRLRIGVAGTTRAKDDPARYVLKRFLLRERPAVRAITKRATEALTTYLDKGLDAARNAYNKSDV